MTKPKMLMGGWVGFLSLMLALPVAAQTARPAAKAPVTKAAPATANAATRHSLWKVDGRSNTVHLLGSVHFLKRENYPLAPVIEAAYANAAVVVFETEMEKMEDPVTQLRILTKATLPDGETLRGQLSPAVYGAFSKHLEEAGMPGEVFDQFRPSFAALTLVALELQKLGVTPDLGVDRHFFLQSQKDGKPAVALEPIDFQIGMITDFTKEEGELLMKSTLKDIAKTRTLYGDMVMAWQTGDGVKLESFLNDATREAPAVYKRLVTDRNERWLVKIEELLRGDRNVLVVVGAGHLVGKDGIVESLRKKGFVVTQR